MTITNDRLNDGILALDVRLDRLEDRFRTIHNVQDNVCTTINKQQHQIYNMDHRISFYSGSIVQLEGKKAEEVQAHFDALEQRITGQDDQIKVLLHCLVAAKEGRCRCQEGTPGVISCRCFDSIQNWQKMYRKPKSNRRPEDWSMRTMRWRPSAAP